MKKMYFVKYSYGVICFCICYLFFSSQLFGQNTPVAGDFRSVTTGNWNDITTWEIFNGAAWQATSATQIPNANSAVFLEAGWTVMLQQDGECKNLFANDIEDVTRLNSQSFDLSVYGKIALYSGSVTDPGGIGAPNNGVPADPSNPVLVMRSDPGGSIKFIGSSDRTIIYDTEFHANVRLAGWSLEFAFTDGIGIINETIRFGNMVASSGTLDLSDADRMLVDETGIPSDINGTVTIKSGAVVQGSRGFWHSGTSAMANLTVEQGGALIFRYTTPVIAAQTLSILGTVGLVGNIDQNFPTTGGRAGAASLTEFGNLDMSLSGLKSLQNDIVINDTLSINGTASVNLNGFTLSYGIAGALEYAGSSAQVISNAEFPAVGGPLNLIINNPSHVSLHAARTIEGDLTLNSGRLILGNNNFTIGENSLAVGGIFSTSNMVLLNGTGILQKQFFQPTAFLFPIGEINTGVPVFTPISIDFTHGTFGANAIAGVSVTNTKHPNDNSAEDYLARYWSVSGTDITSFGYNVEARYLDGDINGQEEDISAFIYEGGVPNILANPDVTLNTILANNITLFGDITGSNLCDISNNTFESVPTTTTFCQESSSLSIDGSTATGSGVLSYSWELRLDGGLWEQISGEVLEDITLAPQAVAGTYDVRRVTTTDICNYPALSESFTFTVLPPISSNSISYSGASTLCVGATPEGFIGATPEGGDNTYVYNWQRRIDGGMWETVGVSSENYHEEDLTEPGSYEYKRLVTSGPCTAPSESNVVTLTVEPAISNNTISTDVVNFCGTGTAFTIAGATPTGGDGVYTYLWERRFNGGAWSSIGTDNINYSESILEEIGTYEYRRLVSSASCTNPATSNILFITLTEVTTVSGIVNDALDSNSDGSILVEVTGGTAPYDFSWSNGAITQNLENVAAGTYSLTVTDNNGCTVSKEFVVGKITGIAGTNKILKFSVFPNPIKTEKLNVEMKIAVASEIYLEVFNNIGKLILKRKINYSNEIKTHIDLSAFPNGVYHLKLITNEWNVSKKIIKSNR